jgi:hypothetical protein
VRSPFVRHALSFADWIFGSHFFDVFIGIAVGAVLSMGLSSERRDISLALWILAITAGLTACRAGHWLLTAKNLPLPRGLLAFVLFGLIGLSWYWLYGWLAKKLDTTAWFSAEVRSAAVSDTGPRTIYMVRHPSSFGDTISPIIYLAYIQIANNEDIPKSINSMTIEVSRDDSGPWEELKYMPLSSMSVLTVSGVDIRGPGAIRLGHGTFRFSTVPREDALKKADITILGPTILENEFQKPLLPHIPVYGWIGLDSFRHTGLAPGRIYFRITLRDGSQSRGSSAVIELPRPVDNVAMEANCGFIEVTGVAVDVSSAHLKYYSDPFPSPEFLKR